MKMVSESSDSEYEDTVPFEIQEAAKNISLNLLPEISKRKYTVVYNDFKKWRRSQKTTSFAEEVFLAYFDQLGQNLAPSTLWARYSMLKATVQAYNDVNIGTYKKVIAYLKKKNVGYKAKKAKILTADDVAQFCNAAMDDPHLTTKVNICIYK